MRVVLCLAGIFLLLISARCPGQALVDAPEVEAGGSTVERASILGTVEDSEGALVPGARVEVVSAGNTSVAFADKDGAFHAYGLLPGHFTLRVTADGFSPVSVEGNVAAGEEKTLDTITLNAAGSHAAVTVYATQHEVAAAQLAEAEKQRVLGVIPNFYVVYEAHPAPLSKGQKFHLAWRSVIDPMNLALNGVAAGVEQATGQFDEYGGGASGYGKRYGAGLADSATSTFLGGAVLPVVFRQDPRYRFQGTGSTGSRLRHAVASVVTCRSDNDKLEFNYSNILGNFASAGISNLYYPASDRHGVGLTLQNVAIGTAFGAFAAVMQEFVIPRFTPKLGNRAKR